MRRRIRSRKIAESLPIFAVAATLGAAPAQSQSPPQTARWAVDGGQLYCTLSRTGDPRVPAFAIRLIPDIHLQGDLVVWSPDWATSPLRAGETVAVRIDPEGYRFESQVETGRLASGNRAIALRLAWDFLHRFENARALLVMRGDIIVMRLDFPSPQRVFQVMRECIDRTRERWGWDLAALNGLRTGPQLEGRFWISDNDYPWSALRNDESGTVLARLRIDETGRVADCTIVRSSGVGALDRRTCQEARAEARYRPALRADGQAVAVDVVVAVRFRIRG